MVNDIYDPLTEYANVFHDRFKEVAERTFADLAKEAQIDIEQNRKTCRQLYEAEQVMTSLQERIGWCTALCVLMLIAVVGGVGFIVWAFQETAPQNLVYVGVGLFLVLLLLLTTVYPHLKKLKAERGELEKSIDGLKKTAWGQMAPLNRLYDWDILTRMMAETVPRLEFDPYFTTQRLADLQAVYGWDDSFNASRSVIYSHSGLINGNPFVICRTRKMQMGEKTYYGSKTIYWTTREYGADGKSHTVHHSQTLTASVTAPYPNYYEKTRLIYGNTAAPDLIFTRTHSGLASKAGSLSFKWKKRALRRKARNLDGADFAMMTNEEFEVAFDTSNRNNNQQYALLFTPLAQESMLKLLKDEQWGFGDDFDFGKHKMINTIVSNHIQELDLDMDPAQYRHFDFDKAQQDFYKINARYFRAIYFCFAPLLCVPMYQQIRSQQDIYGRDMQRHSAFWEHEALANFWGQEHFMHPQCVTDCILKTEQQNRSGDNATITVYAHGYRAVQRLTYISQFGGDGRMHRVPVYWDEYLPVTGKGTMYMQEDNDNSDDADTQSRRLDHIDNVLHKSKLDVYRRHIASKV